MSSEARLAGRTALVTGAGAGIGLATALRLAEEGASVLAADLDTAALPTHPRLSGRTVDVCDTAQLAAAVELAGSGGGLDVCVANAGVFLERGAFVDGDAATARRIVEVNLLGVLETFRLAARAMIAAGRGGRLLATTSTAGLRGEPQLPVYSAAKAGVTAAVQGLAAELRPAGITVNAVAPGPIETAMYRGVPESAAASGRDHLGQPEDVAAAFAFLASPEAGHITGQTLAVDGGELCSG